MDDRGVVEACRGRKACRGSMSWTTGMSWKHVVEDTLFRGGCRGDGVSMSWTQCMSWKHVVGTVLACRGRENKSWRLTIVGGNVVGTGI